MTLNDDSPMPFGKYRGDPMCEVPASYLAWLKDEGCSNRDVAAYIEENWHIIVSELPDRIE